jgi:DNA repair photolyase
MRMNESINEKIERKITFGTKEWADCNVNVIKGCYNNCRYCYAKVMAKRFGRETDESWKDMKVSNDILHSNFKKRKGRIMFPSTHDIFDISPYREACLDVLSKLLENGNEVLITTKPRLAIIKQITQEFNCYKDQIQFRFTVTSIDDGLLKFWEPNAPSFGERLESLRYAFKTNFKTSVSIEPFLDHDPSIIVDEVEPFVTESIWIGRMNYILRQRLTEEEAIFYNSVRKNYETGHLQGIYYKLKRKPKVRFKDSIIFQLLNDRIST